MERLDAGRQRGGGVVELQSVRHALDGALKARIRHREHAQLLVAVGEHLVGRVERLAVFPHQIGANQAEAVLRRGAVQHVQAQEEILALHGRRTCAHLAHHAQQHLRLTVPLAIALVGNVVAAAQDEDVLTLVAKRVD